MDRPKTLPRQHRDTAATGVTNNDDGKAIPRRHASLRDEQKALTRRRLLDAAEAVFARRGYHGASVEEIAREAGATPL